MPWTWRKCSEKADRNTKNSKPTIPGLDSQRQIAGDTAFASHLFLRPFPASRALTH